MKSFNSVFVAALFAAMAIPASALAATDNKDTTGVVEHRGEIGTMDHTTPKGTKTKAQVRKELDAAHKDGSHQMGGEATVVKTDKTAPKKTRAQVKAELAAAHKAGTHEMSGEAPNTSK